MMVRHVWLALGDIVETGLWCPTCLLPSVMKWDLIGYDEDGFVPPFGEVAGCVECAERGSW